MKRIYLEQFIFYGNLRSYIIIEFEKNISSMEEPHSSRAEAKALTSKN